MGCNCNQRREIIRAAFKEIRTSRPGAVPRIMTASAFRVAKTFAPAARSTPAYQPTKSNRPQG